MVKDPFRKWDRVDTVCALLVDLGHSQVLGVAWIKVDPPDRHSVIIINLTDYGTM